MSFHNDTCGSLASDPSAFIYPSSSELSDIVLNHDMVDLLNEQIESTQDITMAAQLRHYSFLSESIERLNRELTRHANEQIGLFEHMMDSEGFRGQIRPIVLAYRQQQRQGLRQQARNLRRRPAAPYSSTTTSSRSSKSSGSSKRSGSIPSSTGSDPSGSLQNPINVDEFLDNMIDNLFKRTLSCDRCGNPGHTRIACNQPIRSFLICETCKWKGTAQKDCDHYDISPVMAKKLRGNHPFDDSK